MLVRKLGQIQKMDVHLRRASNHRQLYRDRLDGQTPTRCGALAAPCRSGAPRVSESARKLTHPGLLLNTRLAHSSSRQFDDESKALLDAESIVAKMAILHGH
jgi:hypothetical protein